MTATATLTRPSPSRARASARVAGGAQTATAVAFPRTWGPYRAPAPQRVPLRVVPTRTRSRRRRRTLVSAWVTVFGLLTVVAFHALLAQSQIALDRLEERTATAERRYEEARYEYAKAASPARVTQRAAEIGLVPPGQPATAVPVAGQVPTAPDAPSTTFNGWTDVKPTLGTTP